jgi:hypothetical protein
MKPTLFSFSEDFIQKSQEGSELIVNENHPRYDEYQDGKEYSLINEANFTQSSNFAF